MADSVFDIMAGISGSIRFDSPALAICVVPLLVLLGLQFRGVRTRGIVPFAGLEYLRAKLPAGRSRRRYARFLLWGSISLGLGLLWAGPVLRTAKPIFLGIAHNNHRHFVVALDVSPSMNLSMEKPKAEQDLAERERAARGLSSGDEGATRYEVARNAVYNFVERFNEARIGLILFSTNAFIARWPTVETTERFAEILDDNIRRGNPSQLASFAGLTNIQAALDQARLIFAKVSAAEGRAVILISDAEDQVENMGAAAQRLREQNIRIYTIGVGVPTRVVDALSKRFVNDPGFRIFHVDSPEEMSEAYQLIGELEESPALSTNQNEFVLELRSLLALALAAIFGIVFYILESRFHQTQSAGARNAGAPGR